MPISLRRRGHRVNNAINIYLFIRLFIYLFGLRAGGAIIPSLSRHNKRAAHNYYCPSS